MGLRIDAERNMSCQGGEVVEEVEGLFGSEYGTSSIGWN